MPPLNLSDLESILGDAIPKCFYFVVNGRFGPTTDQTCQNKLFVLSYIAFVYIYMYYVESNLSIKKCFDRALLTILIY